MRVILLWHARSMESFTDTVLSHEIFQKVYILMRLSVLIIHVYTRFSCATNK